MSSVPSVKVRNIGICFCSKSVTSSSKSIVFCSFDIPLAKMSSVPSKVLSSVPLAKVSYVPSKVFPSVPLVKCHLLLFPFAKVASVCSKVLSSVPLAKGLSVLPETINSIGSKGFCSIGSDVTCLLKNKSSFP